MCQTTDVVDSVTSTTGPGRECAEDVEKTSAPCPNDKDVSTFIQGWVTLIKVNQTPQRRCLLHLSEPGPSVVGR